MDDPGAALALAMDLDDSDPVSILELDKPVADADFFNFFEDDFDDTDLNWTSDPFIAPIQPKASVRVSLLLLVSSLRSSIFVCGFHCGLGFEEYVAYIIVLYLIIVNFE